MGGLFGLIHRDHVCGIGILFMLLNFGIGIHANLPFHIFGAFQVVGHATPLQRFLDFEFDGLMCCCSVISRLMLL
jgi:hypothetical protein